jgi:DNA-binding XRE family transcriptional regulator
MFARIGVMKALNRHVERVFNPSRKDTHWGKRRLARDRRTQKCADMKKAKVNKDAPRNATPVDAYIGARIRERRLALNMSQHELGRALGVSFNQIQKYERGRNRVSAVRLFDICKVFNVSLSSMFERDPGGTRRKLKRDHQ